MTNPTFDNSAVKAQRKAFLESLDKELWSEPIDTAYPDGVKEIADLLTYLPEEKREAAVHAFVGAILYV